MSDEIKAKMNALMAQIEAHKQMQLRINLVLLQKALQEANQNIATLTKEVADLKAASIPVVSQDNAEA